MLVKRNILDRIGLKILDDGCLLCSETTPDQCHRRLLAEYLKEKIPGLEIRHI